VDDQLIKKAMTRLAMKVRNEYSIVKDPYRRKR